MYIHIWLGKLEYILFSIFIWLFVLSLIFYYHASRNVITCRINLPCSFLSSLSYRQYFCKFFLVTLAKKTFLIQIVSNSEYKLYSHEHILISHSQMMITDKPILRIDTLIIDERRLTSRPQPLKEITPATHLLVIHGHALRNC